MRCKNKKADWFPSYVAKCFMGFPVSVLLALLWQSTQHIRISLLVAQGLKKTAGIAVKGGI